MYVHCTCSTAPIDPQKHLKLHCYYLPNIENFTFYALPDFNAPYILSSGIELILIQSIKTLKKSPWYLLILKNSNLYNQSLKVITKHQLLLQEFQAQGHIMMINGHAKIMDAVAPQCNATASLNL